MCIVCKGIQKLDGEQRSIQYIQALVTSLGNKTCSDLTEPFGISYSRGDMYSHIGWKIFIPHERLRRKVMFKPFVCPVLLIPLCILPLLCPRTLYLLQDTHMTTHSHSRNRRRHTHTHRDPGPTAAAGGPHR